MRIDKQIFVKAVEAICKAGGGSVGPWSQETALWFLECGFPEGIRRLFESHIPKSEIWAGAGALFNETRILKWNKDFPEAHRNKLLIVGTAPNGDHIAINMTDGSTGYISHEQNWRPHPMVFFIPVSPSIGYYLRDINAEPPKVSEDYWQAKKQRIA